MLRLLLNAASQVNAIVLFVAGTTSILAALKALEWWPF